MASLLPPIRLGLILLACLAASGADLPPPAYEGLLSEMRSADLVVQVKTDRVEGSAERDPKTGTIQRLIVHGVVVEAYKGDARAGQRIEIDVPYAEQSRRLQRELYAEGHLFFTSGPRAGESVVFLLKDEPRRVINVARPNPVVPRYAQISRLRSDAAAAALAGLYARMTVVERKGSYNDFPHTLVEDLKRYYEPLNDDPAPLAALAAEHRRDIFRAARRSDDTFLPAMWLGSYLPVDNRKQLVALLLDLHAKAAAKLEAAREAKPPADPVGGVDATGGAPAPTPIERFQARLTFLACGMSLLVDPAWHARIPSVRWTGSLIPSDLLNTSQAEQEKSLIDARRFAHEPA